MSGHVDKRFGRELCVSHTRPMATTERKPRLFRLLYLFECAETDVELLKYSGN
jgi:hypothetical protein